MRIEYKITVAGKHTRRMASWAVGILCVLGTLLPASANPAPTTAVGHSNTTNDTDSSGNIKGSNDSYSTNTTRKDLTTVITPSNISDLSILASGETTVTNSTKVPETPLMTTTSTVETTTVVVEHTTTGLGTSTVSTHTTQSAGITPSKDSATTRSPTTVIYTQKHDVTPSHKPVTHDTHVASFTVSTAKGRLQSTTLPLGTTESGGLKRYFTKVYNDNSYWMNYALPLICGVIGALFIVCGVFIVRKIRKRRGYNTVRRPRNLRQMSNLDRMNLLGESSDDDL